MMSVAAFMYEIETSDVCTVVLSTRIELETVSETADEQKPMNACASQ